MQSPVILYFLIFGSVNYNYDTTAAVMLRKPGLGMLVVVVQVLLL